MTDGAFILRLSCLYHKKRERFYKLIDAAAKFLSIVALTALATIDGWFGITIAIISGASTILSIALNFTGMAALHESLASEYLLLFSELQAGDIDEKESEQKRLKIATREPSALRGLVQICQDEIDASLGIGVDNKRLSSWRRLRAHFGFGEMPVDWIPGQEKN